MGPDAMVGPGVLGTDDPSGCGVVFEVVSRDEWGEELLFELILLLGNSHESCVATGSWSAVGPGVASSVVE